MKILASDVLLCALCSPRDRADLRAAVRDVVTHVGPATDGVIASKPGTPDVAWSPPLGNVASTAALVDRLLVRHPVDTRPPNFDYTLN